MFNFRQSFAFPVTGVAFMLLAASAATPADAQENSMMYLVEFQATEAGAPTSREQAVELLGNLIIPSLEQLAGEDKIRAGGLLVGARAGVFIIAADSHEEVTRFVRALPAWGVWRWNVTPLEAFANRAALEKQQIVQLKESD